MKKITKLLTILISAALLPPILMQPTTADAQTALEKEAGSLQRIEGVLSYQTKGEATYYMVSSKTPIKTVDPETGKTIVGRNFQIAGLDAKNWESAKDLLGTNVQIDGRIMVAHSPYHYTPLLILGKQITSPEK